MNKAPINPNSADNRTIPSEVAHTVTGINALDLKGNPGIDDTTWVEVINRMDEVYADLVESQIALEQKHSALEEAQRFIDSVLKAMSDILIVGDINGNILETNQAFESMVGYAKEDLLGTPLRQLFGSDHQEKMDNFDEHIRSGELTDCEVEIIDKSGNPNPMAINCSPHFDAKQRLSGFVVTGRPLGELRRAYADLNSAHERLKNTQNQLIQSEKMASLGRLIAGVAHELNNPISFVFGNMYALQRYGQRFKQYINAIHSGISESERETLRQELKINRSLDDIEPLIEGTREGAERVRNIVQNLSRFSNPKEQTQQNYDLTRLAKTALHWVKKASRNIPEIKLSMPETFPTSGNEGHVHQILINLIQNAFDAVEEQDNASIALTLQQEGDAIAIQVHDNGPGIPDGDLMRIFDPFFTSKPVGKGTGLGLYISYGLATEQCGGELSISNHPNGGVNAVLHLPHLEAT